MKKADIINLIRYHSEGNDAAFRAEAYQIAKEFDKNGDSKLSSYIMALISSGDVLVPQSTPIPSPCLERVPLDTDMLLLPDAIKSDLVGIVNAVASNRGVNKFLFQGPPGTGKTEAVKHLARMLKRELFIVNSAALVDSKLGQTSKNIASLFRDIRSFSFPNRVVVLFDEFDALALDRVDDSDVREMGRAATEIFKGLDSLPIGVVLVATTNLFPRLDKALVRRFDFVVDFNRYSQEDLLSISEQLLNKYLLKEKLASRDIRMFRKIINLFSRIPYPGDLQNLIRTALAFSNPDDSYDYLRRLYQAVRGGKADSATELQEAGFTVREISVLLSSSKSSVGRCLSNMNGDGK